MKLAVIFPLDLPGEVKKILEDEINRLAPDGMETETFYLPKDEKLRTSADVDMKVPPTVHLAVKIEKNGFDAIVLAGT